MRSTFIAIFWCVCSAAASAQCLANAPAPADAATSARVVPVRTNSTGRTSGDLIKSADASTHDDSPSMQPGPPRARPAPERQHRTGKAMLLAALALMSGIALRRYSSKDE